MDSQELQVIVRLGLPDGDDNPVPLEELALRLRQDLLEFGVARVEREQAGPAPKGARAVELVAAGVGLVISSLSTVTFSVQIVESAAAAGSPTA